MVGLARRWSAVVVTETTAGQRCAPPRVLRHRAQDLSLSAASCQMSTPPSERCSGQVFQYISLSPFLPFQRRSRANPPSDANNKSGGGRKENKIGGC